MLKLEFFAMNLCFGFEPFVDRELVCFEREPDINGLLCGDVDGVLGDHVL